MGKEGQLRGSRAKNASDWNGTSLPVSKSNDTAASSLRSTTSYGQLFRFNSDDKYCLSVDANRFSNGQNIQLWECLYTSGQLFFYNLGLIQVAANPRYCVVIDGNQNRNGANIQLWE